MAGIKEIAKAAGVSISTVSYALNGSPKVSEETRNRIQKIVAEMNYVPNMAARTLKKQETSIVGVYLADYGGSFYGELLDGIKRELANYDYEMIVCSGQRSHLFIPEKMVDGAIILDWTFKSKEIDKLADRGHPLVVLDREINRDSVCKVLLDNKGGATLAVNKIIESGSNKVFLVTGPDGYDSQERYKASVKELTRSGIDYDVIIGDFTEPSGYQAAEEIMSKNPQFPVDIFSFNDEMAVGMYKFFANRPEEIGKDIRLIGFDNIELGSFMHPKLATIAYSKHRWGRIAAEKIIQLIHGEKTENERIYTSLLRGHSFP